MYEGAIQPCLHTLGCGVDAFDENYEHILALTETGEMYQLETTITLNFPEPAPISHILMSSLEFWIIVAILMHQVSMIFDNHGNSVSDEEFQRRWSANVKPIIRFGYRGWPARTAENPGTTDPRSTVVRL